MAVLISPLHGKQWGKQWNAERNAPSASASLVLFVLRNDRKLQKKKEISTKKWVKDCVSSVASYQRKQSGNDWVNDCVWNLVSLPGFTS